MIMSTFRPWSDLCCFCVSMYEFISNQDLKVIQSVTYKHLYCIDQPYQIFKQLCLELCLYNYAENSFSVDINLCVNSFCIW